MKTKIAYIIPTLSLGGAEKQQINILNGINTKRFDVRLYILKDKVQLLPQLTNKDIQVKICHIESFLDIGALYHFIIDIKKFSPTIIHSHMYNANLLARFLKIIIPKAKIVNHFHGMSQWMTTYKLLLDKSTSFLVSKFIVVSQKSYDIRLTREKYDKNKMEILVNSVDLKPIQDINNTTLPQSFVIGMASRLIPLKNIEGAIFMLSQLQKRGLELNLIIAGEGPHRKILEQKAKEFGVSEKVKFLGFISKMENFYSQIDIYCISSLTEDMPLSVIEAMNSGKPVITSNVGGIPNLLQDLDSCTLLIDDFFDLDNIDKIENFIKNIDVSECKSKLVNYTMNKYDNQVYQQKLEEIYTELI